MPKQLNIIDIQEKREFWEEINAEALSPEKKQLFLKRKRAVDFYLRCFYLGRKS